MTSPMSKSGRQRAEIMRSTVRFARTLYAAHSASLFLYRAATEVLVLEATSEQHVDSLLGLEVPASDGIAGWVFQTGEAVIADDLHSTPQFNKDIAESTGYLPQCILAAPLETDGVTFGVVEILDPSTPITDSIQTLDLLHELARQCCSSLAALDALNDSVAEPAFSLDRLLYSVQLINHSSDPAARDFLRALESATHAYATQR